MRRSETLRVPTDEEVFGPTDGDPGQMFLELLDMAEKNEELVDHYAARLGRNRDGARTFPHVFRLLNDPTAKLRRLGIHALAFSFAFGNREAAREVEHLMKEGDEARRLALAEGLHHADVHNHRVCDAVERMAQDQSPKVRAAVAGNMHGCENVASTRRLKCLVHDPSAEVREAVTEPWSWGEAFDRYTFEDVQPCFQDRSARVRAHSAAWLSRQPEDVALPHLLSLTRDRNPEVRNAALSALAPFHIPEAEEALLEALHDRSEEVRITATATLVRFPGREVGRALLKLAGDSCARVRANVAKGLAGRVEPDMAKSLVKLTMDRKNANVRAAAAKTLAGLPGPDTDSVLGKLLSDPQEMVRKVARKLLEERGQEVNLPPAVAIEVNHPEGLAGSCKGGFLGIGSGGGEAWTRFLERIKSFDCAPSGSSENLPSAVFTCANGDVGVVMVLGAVHWLGVSVTLPGGGRGRKKAPKVTYSFLGQVEVQGWIQRMGPATFHKGEALFRRLGLLIGEGGA